MRDVRHDSSITEFQQKRGGDSAAFFVPFLTPDVTLLDVGGGPGTITAALAEIVGKAVGVDIEPNAVAAAGRDPDAVYFRCRCECVARKD